MKRVFGFFSFVVAASVVWGVEIPLHRGAGTGGTSVGYVDMEQVFRDYPETIKAREDYQKEVLRHKTELAARETALDEFKHGIDLSSGESPSPFSLDVSSISQGSADTVRVSTATGGASSSAVPADRKLPPPELILKRTEELEKARATSAQTLRAFEAERSKKILGRLYKALVQLADEKGIRLVVDKSAILYGEDTIDLTEALHRRVRGLPEEGK
ncbi:MAG: OmpH family outer membrane protein [Elusimicrobia bacterium]|nr:OmpH family outer membrane protein [Elusimicrobiota bacterium]